MLQTPEDKETDVKPEEEIKNKAKGLEKEGRNEEDITSAVDDKKISLEKEYQTLTDTTLPRVKAAFVVLVRNRELYALRSSMRYLEDRFNHKYEYPWIFLNEEEFTDEFIEMTQSMTKAKVHYGLVPKEHWSYPDWIDQEHAKQCRQAMVDQNIIYGGSESYRHMCRYQSGFFMMHPLLDDLDYYWRVEPGVKFSCDIDYDPFRLMQERDLKYGFTIALREYKATIPTLWNATIDFAKKYPQYIYPRTRPDSLLNFISDDNGWSYNMCHFWSNFEIASLKYMRSEGYQAYFRHLDEAGGFFYERWGDAPVHSIAVAMMLKKSDVHWFYDIGYKHDNFEHCPTEEPWLVKSKCYCDPVTSFDSNTGSCTNLYLKTVNSTASSFIVTRQDKE
ncbi:nucleotide-diphospho-sugar transferase [Choanephora cucurbitarum]|nr:nucleotide-diphospho-sugar transferase [Choanephora cucurbitarum]